jgi:hypothetical protein
MDDDLFRRACAELGYDPASVVLIRLGPDRVDVTYTESSGMPRGRSHQPGRGEDRAA